MALLGERHSEIGADHRLAGTTLGRDHDDEPTRRLGCHRLAHLAQAATRIQGAFEGLLDRSLLGVRGDDLTNADAHRPLQVLRIGPGDQQRRDRGVDRLQVARQVERLLGGRILERIRLGLGVERAAEDYRHRPRLGQCGGGRLPFGGSIPGRDVAVALPQGPADALLSRLIDPDQNDVAHL